MSGEFPRKFIAQKRSKKEIVPQFLKKAIKYQLLKQITNYILFKFLEKSVVKFQKLAFKIENYEVLMKKCEQSSLKYLRNYI